MSFFPYYPQKVRFHFQQFFIFEMNLENCDFFCVSRATGSSKVDYEIDRNYIFSLSCYFIIIAIPQSLNGKNIQISMWMPRDFYFLQFLIAATCSLFFFYITRTLIIMKNSDESNFSIFFQKE